MPLLRIDAHGADPRGNDGRRPWRALARYLTALPKGASLTIVTHGMNHSPFSKSDDPHTGLIGGAANVHRHWKSRSLIRCLHMGEGQRLTGHAIAFGWEARGTVWTAMRRARAAGLALARLAIAIRRLRPDLRLTVVAHSMGARVATEAMLRAPVPIFDRALFLTPADHRTRAARALRAPGGHGCTVVATQTPENWFCNLAFAMALPGLPVLSRGPSHARWVDFHPDRSGLPVWPHRTCHWSCFLRRGVWPLYRAWISGPAESALFKTAQTPSLQSNPAGQTVRGIAA